LLSDNFYAFIPEWFLFLYLKYWYFHSLKRFWDCDFKFVNVLELHQSMINDINKRVLNWRFTLVLIKINHGQIGDQTGLCYTTNPVFYTSGNRFVRRTGTFGNLIFSLVPSDNRNTRSTCPTSVFTGIGQTLMSRPETYVWYLYRFTCHICRLACHICKYLRVIFVQTYMSYLYRLTSYMSYLYRLTCHICTDLCVIFVQIYMSYLYRLMCHICIDLHVIFVQTYMSYL
jgi:hypothetical protein